MTDALDRRAAHLRGLKVTALAALAGIVGALLSAAVATGATDLIGVSAFVAVVIIQFPLLRALGVDVEDFSPKDFVYVGFMTFSLWFVSWAILLTAGVSL